MYYLGSIARDGIPVWRALSDTYMYIRDKANAVAYKHCRGQTRMSMTCVPKSKIIYTAKTKFRGSMLR